MDEFSDFQMAVQKPPPKVVNIGLPYKNGISSGKASTGLRFPDSSPVHSLTSHHGSKADLVCSQLRTPTPPVQNVCANVGSRLANYDLGLSVPPGQSNGVPGNTSFSSNVMGLSMTSKTITTPSRNNNQDLLIGEEDKYSALRMLIETDIESTTSVFETPKTVQPISEINNSFVPPQVNSIQSTHTTMAPFTYATSIIPPSSISSPQINSNLVLDVTSNHHSSSSQNSNLMSALQTSAMNPDSPAGASGDSSSDFGDFQSFTGFTLDVQNQNESQSQQASQNQSLKTPNLGFDEIMGDLHPFPSVKNPEAHHTPSPMPPLQRQSLLEAKFESHENGTCDSDGEFGDFVSVEPAVLCNRNDNVTSSLPVLQPTSKPSVHQNFDLSQLTTTATPTTPSNEVNKGFQDIQFNSNIGNLNFAKTTTTAATDSFNQSSPEKKQQEFVDDDINNIVLGQGLDWESSSVATDAAKSANQPPPPFFPTLTPSSFIRTSLIRNDEVTDIDPIKWNQSVAEESNNDCALDYNSFDKKDFSSSNGKSKFLDVSPETRSVASLDLGSYVTVDYPENTGSVNNIVNNNNSINNNNNNGKLFSDQPVMLQHHQHYSKTSAPSTAPLGSVHPSMLIASEDTAIYDDYDKYQCFREECENEKERYFMEWNRCLQACKALISNAFVVFNSVSNSEVIREVVSDDKGYSYVINIFEIYQISQRIQKSAEKVGLEAKVRSICLEINNLWETLTAFLLGTCVSAEISEAPEVDCTESHEAFPSCGVCLCEVNTSQSSQYLDYGGKIYHSKCANLWVNEVDAILPSLNYVSNSSVTAGHSGGARN